MSSECQQRSFDQTELAASSAWMEQKPMKEPAEREECVDGLRKGHPPYLLSAPTLVSHLLAPFLIPDSPVWNFPTAPLFCKGGGTSVSQQKLITQRILMTFCGRDSTKKKNEEFYILGQVGDILK